MKKRINIINYDSIVKEPEPKFHVEQLKSPFSGIISAPRASGKTNFLINALIGEDGEPLFYYDKLFILSLSKSQRKYKFLVDYFQELADDISQQINKKKRNDYNDYNDKDKEPDVKIESILTITSDWRDLPKMEHREEDDDEEGEHHLYIFDDVLKLYDVDKEFRTFCDLLYIAGRHSKNPISPLFLTQKYTELDSTLRGNSTANFFMGFPTRSLLNVIAASIPICDYRMYKEIFKENIQNAYDFIYINTAEPDIDKKIYVDNMNTSIAVKDKILDHL